MKPRFTLLIVFFLAAGAATRVSAQASSDSLEAISTELLEATGSNSMEDARKLSSKALDGAVAAAPEVVIGDAYEQSGSEPNPVTARRKPPLAAKVPELPEHVPPKYQKKDPGALDIILEAPLSIVTVPITMVIAAYHLGSSPAYLENHRTMAKVTGSLTAIVGFLLGLLLSPLAILHCLEKAIVAISEGRWYPKDYKTEDYKTE